MANVLEKIVIDKRAEIAARKKSLPLESFVQALTPSTRSFYNALAQPNAGYILECKKASPSKGLIRAHFDLDEIIHAYAPHAACISVLTDEKYFQGTFEYLEYVRARVTQPVINKDFIVEAYQVYLARYHNADAILLMLSVLSDDEYRTLSALAAEYQLDVLTEVSNEDEVHRAVALDAKIIGINNRNLRDLSTDLATTEQLVPLLASLGHKGLIISESGIYTHADVRRLAPLVDGFLVGSSLMAEKNVAKATQQLVHGKIKVCGITKVEDAQFVADSPACYMGLIFAEQSKRCVRLAQAQKIVAAVPFQYVGVFVDAPLQQVVDYAKQLNLAAVQLHGNEDQSYIDRLRKAFSGQIWQVVTVNRDAQQLADLSQIRADRILLDCKVGKQSGGTGQAFDWSLFAPLTNKQKLVLAGGISPENIQQALASGAGLIDINSGVESAPGKKDAHKLAKAWAAARTY